MKTMLKTMCLFPFLFHWMIAFGYQPLDDFLTLATCLPEIVKIEIDGSGHVGAIIITESEQKELAKCMQNVRELCNLLVGYTPKGDPLQISSAHVILTNSENKIKKIVVFPYNFTEYAEEWL